MTLTPSEIEKKTFSESGSGYSAKEVNDFLDVIVTTLRELRDQLDTAEAEAATLREPVESIVAAKDEAEAVAKEPEEDLVFAALADQGWDFRTIPGVSRSTGLESERVETIVQSHLGSRIRESTVPGRHGRRLFTIADKKITPAEQWALSRLLISKST